MEETTAKVGIDGGGGFFKVCLSLYDKDKSEKKGDGRFLYTGVKKIFLLLICPEIKESYSNVRDILQLLKISDMLPNCTYSVDLKLANIMAGIQAHGSTYPCIWCECPKTSIILMSIKSIGFAHLGQYVNMQKDT